MSKPERQFVGGFLLGVAVVAVLATLAGVLIGVIR